MMNKLGSTATTTVIGMLLGPTGMNSGIASLTSPDNQMVTAVGNGHVYAQNVATDLAERSTTTKYPSVYVYCEKIANTQAEKFRSFSGSLQMAIEVRHSQDRLDGLQDALELYVDSATQVLNSGLGDWGNGLYYSGGYDVTVGAVKHGGKNFIQAAKITFRIEVSRN
jgi:hypothetical protein